MFDPTVALPLKVARAAEARAQDAPALVEGLFGRRFQDRIVGERKLRRQCGGLLVGREAETAAAAAACAAALAEHQVEELGHQREGAGLRAGRVLAVELIQRVVQLPGRQIDRFWKSAGAVPPPSNEIVDRVADILLVDVGVGGARTPRRGDMLCEAGRALELRRSRIGDGRKNVGRVPVEVMMGTVPRAARYRSTAPRVERCRPLADHLVATPGSVEDRLYRCCRN